MSEENDDYVEVYQDGAGYWRWRKKDGGNYAKIASSGEGFGSKNKAVRAGFRANPGTPVFVATAEGLIEVELVEDDEDNPTA